MFLQWACVFLSWCELVYCCTGVSRFVTTLIWVGVFLHWNELVCYYTGVNWCVIGMSWHVPTLVWAGVCLHWYELVLFLLFLSVWTGLVVSDHYRHWPLVTISPQILIEPFFGWTQKNRRKFWNELRYHYLLYYSLLMFHRTWDIISYISYSLKVYGFVFDTKTFIDTSSLNHKWE